MISGSVCLTSFLVTGQTMVPPHTRVFVPARKILELTVRALS